MNIVVCIKQVPMVSELPWDRKTRTLKRDTAEGMMNPMCRRALEAALQLKEQTGGKITAVTMGPSQAEEVLYEALALGVDRGLLLCDRRMAGADTLATSYTLACAIKKKCPDFDLILCGCATADSETAQIGPQLADDLDIPAVSYVDSIELKKDILRLQRVSDEFLETHEMQLPGLVTVSGVNYSPRYVPVSGLEDAFKEGPIEILSADDIGAAPESIGAEGSATKILNVYSPSEGKDNVVLKGTPKKIVEELFERFGDRIAGVIEKDLAAPKK